MLSDRCPVCLSVCLSMSVYCGQTIGWIKMKLGMEVGVGPDHIVLDGDPVPLKGHTAQPPNFRPMSIVAKLSPISATVEHLFAVANATSENVHRSCKGENGIFCREFAILLV